MKKLFVLLSIPVLFTFCTKSTEQNNNEPANMAMAQRFYDDVMNAHNITLIDSFCATEFVDHQQNPHYPKGMAGLKAAFSDFFAEIGRSHV